MYLKIASYVLGKKKSSKTAAFHVINKAFNDMHIP